MKSKVINFVITILIVSTLIIILNTPNVNAIGVSPGRTTINYQPGLEQEVRFTVINPERKEMNVVFYVRGDMASNVKLNEKTAKFNVGEESKTFTYTVKLPNEIDKAGLQKTEIVIMEVPKETIKTEGGKEIIVLDSSSVSATLAVITQLNVFVLHPGKYLDAELEVIPEDSGMVKFLVPIISRGKLGIGAVKANIDVYTSLNEKIATIETNSLSLGSQERKELLGEWDATRINPGRYRAVATITYDGETTYADKNFDIGKKVLEIERIEVNNFKLGEIAKFNILVNNNWNEEIKDVNVQIIIYNKEGQIMADFKSANYDVSALGKTELVSYWDTIGVKEGTYEGKLALKYSNEISERPLKIKVSDDNIEIEGFTGKAILPDKKIFTLQNILIGFVILLVMINVVWFYLMLKKKRRKKAIG